MPKPLTIFLILFLFVNAKAQDTSSQKKYFDVSVSLAGLGGDYVTNSMGIQAGVEFRLKNNVAMQCDLRYIFDVYRQKGYGQLHIDVNDLEGFAINTEFKVYPWQYKTELRGGYIGGRMFFLYTVAMIDNDQVRRSKAGVYGIIGWKHIAKSGFLFETSAGLGVQLISSYTVENSIEKYSHSYEFPWGKPYDSGTAFYPDLSLNLRIGWRF